MLTFGLLPGPREVKKHRINHFLSPIIDELIELWDGYELPDSSGKRIRLAVICCSNDIPAARKLCGHISALAACHRCYKQATGDEGQRPNFSGFNDMSSWFIMRDPDEHRQNAASWLHCRTEDERKNHVSSTLARKSEMLRLPYHDPIRHLVVDPMHCLFLGIAHWIVKRLWVNSGKITKPQLEEMEKKMKLIKLPSDLGRIPNKISIGEGFSGFTADQWKTFILVYTTPLLWNILRNSDQKILSNFVRACFLLTLRIIDNNALNEAHSRLLEVAVLIEENYRLEFITPNIHLSLHLAECCRDYGPLHSFWCYSFERMNGILGRQLMIFQIMKFTGFNLTFILIGSLPNSRRNIEPELLRIIMQNWRLDNLISDQLDNSKLEESLNLIQSRPTVESLAAYDEFEFDELRRFLDIY